MFDLDKLINEAYDGEAMSFEKLAEMVEDMMVLQESLGILSEDVPSAGLQDAEAKAKAEIPAEWHKLLPKIEISERWGMADTDDNTARKQFETYMSAIGGGTVKEKLSNIVTFVNNKTKSTDTREVLSNIIFLDLLSTVVNNFSPSGAGFLFEAFLAGLLGGTQIVGKTEEGVLDIDDLEDAEGRPISLKLLVPTTGVKGSIENLLKFMARSPKAQKLDNPGIIYLCVYKYGKEKSKALGFYEFTIDTENIYYWLSDEFGFTMELSESMMNERRFKQEPSVAGRIGQKGKNEYDVLKAKQAKNDILVQAAVGMGTAIKTSDLIGKIAKAKEMFIDAGSGDTAALKTAIEALDANKPITIDSAVKIDTTDFSQMTDKDIQEIYMARRKLLEDIKKKRNRRSKDATKNTALATLKAAYDAAHIPAFFGLTDKGQSALGGKTGPGTNLNPAIDQLTSLEAKKGLTLMRKVAKDYDYDTKFRLDPASEPVDALTYFNKSKLEKMGGEAIVRLIAARKKIRTDLRSVVRPDNEYMGYFQQTFSKATPDNLDLGLGNQRRESASDTIERFKALYATDKNEWLSAMLQRYKDVNALSAAHKKAKKDATVTNENLIMEAAETQFEINSDLITKNRLPSIYKHERLGVLKIDEESVKELASSYAEDILGDIVRIFVALDKVTKGITSYFLADSNERVTHADEAQAGLSELQVAVQEEIK